MSYAAEIARSVSRYEPGDRPALREFQREHFGANSRHVDDEFFEWLFERNPYGDPAGPSLWICKRDGVVVAQQASIPVPLKVGDSEIRGGWMIDWMVHPAWRLKGISPALFAVNAATNDVMLGLGLEEVAYRTVRRAGWTDAGRLSLFVRPLDPGPCAEVLGLPKLLSKLTPRVLVGGSAAAIGRAASAMTGLSLDAVDAFDERVESIWRSVSPGYPVLVKRDLASVRWRYDEGPHRAAYSRYYLTRRGQVLGYVVLRLAKWRGHIVGRVADYFAERRWLMPLLALVIEELKSKGAIAVFFEQWQADSGAVLRSLGCFRIRPSHRFMFNLRDKASPFAATLGVADNWFVTPGDSDFDHILIDMGQS